MGLKAEEVAYGSKGKGILIHTLTEGNGMPLAKSTSPANGNEREQELPHIMSGIGSDKIGVTLKT